MYTDEQLRNMVSLKPNYVLDNAGYSRWRYYCQRLNLPTRGPMVTPEKIRERNRAYAKRKKATASTTITG